MTDKPPPIIHSAKTLCYAVNDESVQFTGRMNLFVGDADNLEKLGEMPLLAICSSYRNPEDILLFFCNEEWEPQGTVGLESLDEAKAKAEAGYKGITGKWVAAEAPEEEINSFLREVCEVDPDTEWWKVECAFCQKDDSEVSSMLGMNNIFICEECINMFHDMVKENENA